MAVDHHRRRVADETDVDAGGVEVHRGGVVVGGDHGDGLGGAVLLAQLAQRDALGRALRGGPRIHRVLGNVAHAPDSNAPHQRVTGVSRSQQTRHCAVQSAKCKVQSAGKRKRSSI